ncbi:hypothetical protein ACFLYU_00265 [Candidatus Dependentiae bacterium]
MNIKKILFSSILFLSISSHTTTLPHNKQSYPYITGSTLASFCDYIIPPNNKIRFDPAKIKDGSKIFATSTDSSIKFFFTKVHPKINAKYVLITHDALYKADLNVYKKYLDEDKVIAWFGKNLFVDHPKAYTLPLGIVNQSYQPGNTKIFDKLRSNLPKKDILLYMNFRQGTGPGPQRAIRQFVWDFFSDKKYCTKTAYSTGKNAKSFNGYINDVARSKFTLSPRGGGVDCYRTWEAMLVGSIPIVETSPLDPILEGLPIIIIDDWTKITEEFLIQKYEEITSKTYNLEKLFIPYWLDKINQVIHSNANTNSNT